MVPHAEETQDFSSSACNQLLLVSFSHRGQRCLLTNCLYSCIFFVRANQAVCRLSSQQRTKRSPGDVSRLQSSRLSPRGNCVIFRSREMGKSQKTLVSMKRSVCHYQLQVERWPFRSAPVTHQSVHTRVRVRVGHPATAGCPGPNDQTWSQNSSGRTQQRPAAENHRTWFLFQPPPVRTRTWRDCCARCTLSSFTPAG